MWYSTLQAIIIERKIHRPPVQITYPEITGLKQAVEEGINTSVKKLLDSMLMKQGGYQPDLEEMLGSYKITLNEKGTLSIRFENYAYIRQHAHGTTLVDSLTYNLNTAREYKLRDLFQPGSNYRFLLDNLIKQQIKTRDIPVINDFTGINDNQAFYLTPRKLVVYFQEAELAPRYYGVVEFSFPYSQLINVINPRGPLVALSVK